MRAMPIGIAIGVVRQAFTLTAMRAKASLSVSGRQSDLSMNRERIPLAFHRYHSLAAHCCQAVSLTYKLANRL